MNIEGAKLKITKEGIFLEKGELSFKLYPVYSANCPFGNCCCRIFSCPGKELKGFILKTPERKLFIDLATILEKVPELKKYIEEER